MADTKKTVEILFSGVDNVSGALDSVGKGISGIGEGIQGATQPFADLTAAIGATEAAFAGLVGVAIAGKAELEDLPKTLGAALGGTAEEAEAASEAVKNIFSQGFGIEEATESVTLAFQQFADKGVEELERISESAVKVTNTFDAALPETIDAAKVLMENLGLSSDEAFGFITTGFQKGLDRSGDFLDSIREYGNIFESAGFEADEFFSLMETGAAGGVLGVDKIADAVKEFQIKLAEGTDGVKEGFAFFGEDYDEIVAKIESGAMTSADAFGLIIGKVKDVPPNSLAAKKAIAEFGTQFEDMANQIQNVDLGATKIDEFKKGVESLDQSFDTIGQAAKAAYNTMFREFADSDALDSVSDKIKDIFSSIVKDFPAAFEGVDFSGLNDAILDIIDKAEGLLSDFFGGADFGTPEGIEDAIQQIIDAFTGFQEVVGGVIDGMSPLIDIIGDAVEFFSDLSPEAQKAIGIFLAAATQLNLAGVALSTVGGSISGVAGTISSSSDAVKTATGSIVKFATSLGLKGGGLVLAAGAAGAAIGTLINQLPGVQEGVQGTIAEIDNFLGGVLSAGPTVDEIEKIDAALFAAQQQAKKNIEKLRETEDAINDIPDDKQVNIATTAEEARDKLSRLGDDVESLTANEYALTFGVTLPNKEEIDELDSKIKELTEKKRELVIAWENGENVGKQLFEIDDQLKEMVAKRYPLQVELDDKAADQTKKQFEELYVTLEDGSKISIQVPIDEASKKETKEELEKLVPPDKRLELQIDLDIARVEASAQMFEARMEAVQSAVEWEAKLEIAQVEAATAQIEAAFESVTTTISSTGDVLSSIFGLLGEDLDFQSKWAVFDQIERENELRERAVDMQERLIEAQISALAKWEARLDSDQPIALNISTDNLAPHLEMIWTEVIEALQDQAVLEGGDMLVGMLPTASAT